jgi:hypothetical protein
MINKTETPTTTKSNIIKEKKTEEEGQTGKRHAKSSR